MPRPSPHNSGIQELRHVGPKTAGPTVRKRSLCPRLLVSHVAWRRGLARPGWLGGGILMFLLIPTVIVQRRRFILRRAGHQHHGKRKRRRDSPEMRFHAVLPHRRFMASSSRRLLTIGVWFGTCSGFGTKTTTGIRVIHGAWSADSSSAVGFNTAAGTCGRRTTITHGAGCAGCRWRVGGRRSRLLGGWCWWWYLAFTIFVRTAADQQQTENRCR